MNQITLYNGIDIPQIGLGVYQAPVGSGTVNAVKWAIEAGYRHIDTAKVYGNEEDVGTGILESGVPREDIFLTTKLWNDDIREGRTREAFEKSLEALQTDYVDLYLIHWPVDGFEMAWLIMEELYQEGKIRAIGLSNFHEEHLNRLKKIASVMPAVNQIESHPYMNNQSLIEFNHSLGIEVEAWRPLGGTGGNLLEDVELNQIAKKYGKSVAQIVLRWDVQRGLIVLPKSIHKDRIASNIDVFDFCLDAEDMKRINQLNRNVRLGPDPDNFTF
ncbi:MAG: aldo/keto reductase [Anaerostipes sp.]|nr:aldo/keto reductase [Anaerostipes sp.]